MASKRLDRRLSAILAADVAGYGRLMGADEEGTIGQLKGHRTDLFDPKLAEHHGRLVKTTGDGLLAEFASVVDAVRCAVEVQRGMATRNTGITPERRLDFRIGVHVGDIIVENDDIFGDGVNVAARLEGLAEPGGICVSARVHEDVDGRLGVGFIDEGERQLKNFARPVRVYRVRLDNAMAQAATKSDVKSATPGGARRPRHAVDRGPAVPEHERGPRAGILRRRHCRRHHHGAVPLPSSLRHRAQLQLHLQGPRRRHEAGRPGARRALSPGGQRAQGRIAHPHHRAAHRYRDRGAYLGRSLRGRA